MITFRENGTLSRKHMNTIGYRIKKNKELLTSETWKQIEERKNIKLKMIKTKSIRMQEQPKAAYATKNKGQRSEAAKCKKRQENICR